MSAIRSSLLGKIFNNSLQSGIAIPDISSLDPLADSNLGAGQGYHDKSISTLLSEELDSVAERLCNISASSFNVAELAFETDLAKTARTEPVPTPEHLIKMLVSGNAATRRFISTVESLKSLAHDVQDIMLESDTCEGDLTLRCESIMTSIDSELTRLVVAAHAAHLSQASRKESHNELGARLIDFPIPPFPGYRMSPIATAAIIILSIIHCFMSLSRENCNFILRAIRALLRLVHQMQQSRPQTYLTNNMDKIPTTLDTALHYLGIQADLVFYASCPKCSTLYPETFEVPERCGAIDIDRKVCGAPLLVGKHRGTTSWKKPRRRFSHQLFEIWLSRFLARPGIEELIEKSRPVLQHDCTDFWGAPLLSHFPGVGQKSFFDTTIDNLRLVFLVYHDFFNPFTNKMAGKQNSVGVIFMVCLNLPYQIRYNRENIYTAAVIPGPSVPKGEQINRFMRPVAQNLKEHYHPGVWIARTHKYPNGRHVRSAAVIESMDLGASQGWNGLGSPAHTLLCSGCGVTQDQIDQFKRVFPPRTMQDHIQHVQLWLKATSSKARDEVWRKYGARYSEWLCFPFANVFLTSTIAPMHWTKNILEKQLRENMGWSWTLADGIPVGPKSARPITQLELEWGKAALQYCDSTEFRKAGLTESLLRYICHEEQVFHVGLLSRRMIEDLDRLRLRRGIVTQSGKLASPLPSDWSSFNRVSVAKADFYLSKTKDPNYLVRKSHIGDLRHLCRKYGLSPLGTQTELAARLVANHNPSKADQAEVKHSNSDAGVAVLGMNSMARIQRDMENTIIPSWMKTPPKNFGTISHRKIGAEEYKSLTLVSFTITLVRIWSHAETGFSERLKHFLHLMLAIRVLALQTISPQDINSFSYHYSQYLSELKALYPHCSIIPTQHLGLHIPAMLRNVGPATRFNENPCEMFIGMLQDIPTNWRFGELEYTLHREFTSASNLAALLQQSDVIDALGQVGEVVQDFLNVRHPSNSGVFMQGWTVVHPSKPSIISDEIYALFTSFCLDRGVYPPTRRQFTCSKIQNGHVIYQPESSSLGNSQVLYKAPGMHDRTAGRIEAIILQSEHTGSRDPPQIALLVRPFKHLASGDCANDLYRNNPLIGEAGSQIAMLFYDEFESEPPTIVHQNDIICHIATCKYPDDDRKLTAPCVVVLSLDLVGESHVVSSLTNQLTLHFVKQKHPRP